jgi:hypothetical protein
MVKALKPILDGENLLIMPISYLYVKDPLYRVYVLVHVYSDFSPNYGQGLETHPRCTKPSNG